jgi:dolichol-phosphate mannosyltransferase
MIVVVIIPTYNEAFNISQLIPALQHEFSTISHDMHILVVDDNSPDGTGCVVQKIMQLHKNVHLITGEKSGLGAAYIRGMGYALKILRAEVILEMDADFSHHPSDVPRLLSAIETSADFVIGSRYVDGGRIPQEWGFLRKINSLAGNYVARWVAGLYKVKDCTAGFRAIRAWVLREIDLQTLKTRGYAFQIELLYLAVSKKARIKEIPVFFTDRVHGTSKLSLRDIKEFLGAAFAIRLTRIKPLARFFLIGGIGAIINISVLQILINVGVGRFIASPIAIEASIMSNFLWHKNWTFYDTNRPGNVFAKASKFHVGSFLSLLITFSVFTITSLIYPKSLPAADQAIAILPGAVANYLISSRWIFRKEDTVL